MIACGNGSLILLKYYLSMTELYLKSGERSINGDDYSIVY